MSASLPPDSDDASLREQAEQWWLRLRDPDFSRADAETLRQWCARSPAHRQAWADVSRVWSGIGPGLAGARAAAPARRAPGLRRMPGGRRAFLGAAVAAGAAVVAVRPPLHLFPSALDYLADFRTGTAERRDIALADGLQLQMNTQTRINRRAAMAGVPAVELLAGEAELAAAAPVAVHAGGGAVLARQARANIRYTGPQVCVTCLEGELDVERGSQRRRLAAGRQVIYDAQGLREPVYADVAQVSAWRSGILSFADQTLMEVVDEINRYRPGRVLVRNPALAARRVRMRFSIAQTDLALRMLRDLYGAQVTELPAGIVLLS